MKMGAAVVLAHAAVETVPRADHHRSDEARETAKDVHWTTACKVVVAQILDRPGSQPGVGRPHPMRNEGVHQRGKNEGNVPERVQLTALRRARTHGRDDVGSPREVEEPQDEVVSCSRGLEGWTVPTKILPKMRRGLCHIAVVLDAKAAAKGNDKTNSPPAQNGRAVVHHGLEKHALGIFGPAS